MPSVTAASSAHIQRLRTALRGSLPSGAPPRTELRPAAVLVGLGSCDADAHVVLTRRPSTMAEHRSEVAFPGGKLEPADADVVACALREAHEELSIAPDAAQVLGLLSPVSTRTGYQVWPVVAALADGTALRPDPREVAQTLEIPLTWLADAGSRRHEARLGADGTLHRRPSYVFGPHVVYGATALILAQLLSLLALDGAAPDREAGA